MKIGFTPGLTDEHRADLHASGITDEALEAAGVWSTHNGWILPWADGTERIDLLIPDRDKRPADGRKVMWPKGKTLIVNLLRMTDSDDLLVVEAPRQSLAALSHAPAGFSVVGINGCDGIHRQIPVSRYSWAEGKRIWLAFDADHRTNDRVRGAVERVTSVLTEAGAKDVRLIDLSPLAVEKNDGLDDILARAEEPGDVLAGLIAKAKPVGKKVEATSRLDDAFFALSDLAHLPAPEPLLTGLLDRATVAVLAGKFGTYKSFVALAWGASIASGKPWGSFTVPETRPVIYVAAEGASGIRKRLTAWQEKNGAIPDRFYAVIRPVKMTSDEDAEWLREKVRETGAGLVVIDTWRQSTPGAEENSNTEMSAAFSRVASIRSDTGATMLVVHHTGHAGERSRGASSIEDDADSTFVIKLAGQDAEDRSAANPRVMEHRKAKDGELLSPTGLVAHEVGESLVVEPSPFATSSVSAMRRQRGRGRPTDPGREQAIQAMVEALDRDEVPLTVGYKAILSNPPAGLARVTEPIIKEAIQIRRGRGAEVAELGNPPRGELPPQQPTQACGGNSDELPPPSSPAETSLAEACGGNSSGITSASPAEVIPDELPQQAWDGSSLPPFPACPECGEGTVLVNGEVHCVDYPLLRCDYARPLDSLASARWLNALVTGACPDCHHPVVRNGSNVECFGYDEGACDWYVAFHYVAA